MNTNLEKAFKDYINFINGQLNKERDIIADRNNLLLLKNRNLSINSFVDSFESNDLFQEIITETKATFPIIDDDYFIFCLDQKRSMAN